MNGRHRGWPDMRSLAQLTFLKRGQSRPAGEDDEGRVLALFRNRAELKKAYGELQDEVYRLKDRIKQQEGATARVQEMLGALESRLGLVETAYPALVFYQLRALWQRGREIIEQFVGELQSQQEERERRAHLAECNRRQFARRQSIEAALRAAETQFADAQHNLATLEQARAKLTRFWHYFKRREADRRIAAARAGAGTAVSRSIHRGATRDQSRCDRLRGSPVSASGAHPARGAGARGGIAPRGRGSIWRSCGMRSRHRADR